MKPDTTDLAITAPAPPAILTPALAGRTLKAGDLDRIKMPAGSAGTFALPDAGGTRTVPHFDAIVLDYTARRTFWAVPFGERAAAAPDCASRDGELGEGTPGGPCIACPMARFGDDGDAPQCRELREVLVLLAGECVPSLFSVSPASLRPFDRYVLSLLKKGLAPHAVVTRLALAGARNQAGLAFSALAPTMLDRLEPAVAAQAAAAATLFAPLLRGEPVTIPGAGASWTLPAQDAAGTASARGTGGD